MGERWRLGYRPELDGLRAVAIIAVIGHHLDVPGMAGGSIGVDLFFVLSGFLITALLVEELRETGRIRLGLFYRRRALRLLPALAFLLLVVGLIAANVPEMTNTRRALPVIALYAGNWWRAFGHGLGALGHTWSLAVEEQFYLLWPIAFLVLVGRRQNLRRALIGCVVAITVVVVGRSLAWSHGAVVDRLYNGSDTRADALLVGCAIAFAYHHGIRARVGRVAAGVAVTFLLVVMASTTAEDGFLYLGGLTLVAIGAGVVLCASIEHSPAFLRSPLLGWIGRRSYGLYLWHVPLVRLLPHDWSLMTHAAVVIPATLAAAAISYRLVERPFLALKRRTAGPPSRAAKLSESGPGRRPERRRVSVDQVQRGVDHVDGLPHVPPLDEEQLHVERVGTLIRRREHGDHHISKGEVVEAGHRTVQQRFRSLLPLATDLVAGDRIGCQGVPRVHWPP